MAGLRSLSRVSVVFMGLYLLGGTLVLPHVSAQPVNDDCAAPTAAVLGVNPIDTVLATTSPETFDAAQCAASFPGTSASDVWYSFTPNNDGLLTVSTCNTVNFDSTISLYDATGGCGALTQLACEGDTAGCATFTTTLSQASVLGGVSYLIRIGGFNAAATGTGTFTVEFFDLLPVQNLTCNAALGSPSQFDLAWANQGTYDSIEIYVDNMLTATLLGNAAAHTTAALAPGAHQICVLPIATGLAAPLTCCSVSISQPCPMSDGVLTHLSNSAYAAGAVACAAANQHADSYYYRTFSPQGGIFNLVNDITVSCMELGIDLAQPGPGLTTQPVRIRLYDLQGSLSAANVAASPILHEETFQLPALADTVHPLVFSTPVTISCGTNVVLELFTPNGQTVGHSFFMGTPAAGTMQTSPSYVRFPPCGIAEITTMAALGFGGQMWIMDLHYDLGSLNCGGSTPAAENLQCETTPGATTIEVSWSLPANPSSPITAFDVYVNTLPVATLAPTATSFTTLAQTPYTFADIEVRATSLAGMFGAFCTAPVRPPHNSLVGALTAFLGATPFDINNTYVNTTGQDLDPLVCDLGTGSNSIFNDLWYCFTAISSGPHHVSTCNGTTFDSRLAVYTGCASDDPNLVEACNDDSAAAACTNFAAELTFDAVAGNSYLIRVGTFNAAGQGAADLVISDCPPPSNVTVDSDCTNGEVTLTFDVAPNAGDVTILRNMVQIAVLSAPHILPLTYLDTSAPAGQNAYELVADCVGGPQSTLVSAFVQQYAAQTDILLALEGLQSAGDVGAIDSAAALEVALSSQPGVTTLVIQASPLDYTCLGDAERIWVLTGTFPDDYRLSAAEADALAALSALGIGIYLEGSDHWGFAHVASNLDNRDGVEQDVGANIVDGDDSFTAMNGAATALGIDLSAVVAAVYSQDQTGIDYTDRLSVTGTTMGATPDPEVLAAEVLWRNADDTMTGEPPYITGIIAETIEGSKMISSSWEFGGYQLDPMNPTASDAARAALAGLYLGAFSSAPPAGTFVRGRCNGDNAVNIADAVYLLGFLFPGANPPNALSCLDACDANDDGSLNIADVIRLLASLFGSTTVPLPLPNSGSGCGVDPTGADLLDCASAAHCP